MIIIIALLLFFIWKHLLLEKVLSSFPHVSTLQFLVRHTFAFFLSFSAQHQFGNRSIFFKLVIRCTSVVSSQNSSVQQPKKKIQQKKRTNYPINNCQGLCVCNNANTQRGAFIFRNFF